MFLLIDIGKALFSETLQVISGCMLSILLYVLYVRKANRLHDGPAPEFLLMAAAAFCGVVLPLGTYGIIPILVVALAAGMKHYTVLPLFISNALFNMLVPFTYVGFVWRTGIYRLLLAFIAGMCAGVLVKQLRLDKDGIWRSSIFKLPIGKTGNPPGYLYFLNNYVNTVGPYLIFGVILNTIFMKYFFYRLMNTVNIGLIASNVFSRFKGYDITTPVFLLTMVIFNMLVNLKAFSGLLVLFKWKGVLGYFLYYSVWIVVLVLLNFIV